MATAKPSAITPIFRYAFAPFRAFLHLEAASGILLAASAVIALIWANSDYGDLYRELVEYPLSLGVGAHVSTFTVHALINDGLMAIFFFVVGMEIKRELAVGELRSFSKAMLPLVAAVGGVVVPAAIYLAFNWGGPGAHGWAIPMATDIAFSIGVLTMLKGRVPYPLIIFLTALAIFDDLGGILVIAFFYGSGLHLEWLGIAAAVTGVLFVCNRLYVRNGLVWTLLGVALWYALHHGGIHSTIAGVIVGMMIPALPIRPGREVLEDLHRYSLELLGKPADESIRSDQIHYIEDRIEDVEPPLNRFEHLLHPYVAYFIVPIFALVNSGVSVKGMSVSDLGAAVPMGILLGLFVGKQVGIFAFTVAAVKLRLAEMPGNAKLMQLWGVSLVAGIGFTVALFVAGLAFTQTPELLESAKLGILLGSLLSAVVGALVLRFSGSSTPRAER